MTRWAIGFADREYDRVMTNGAPLGYVEAESKAQAERTAAQLGMGRGHLCALWAWPAPDAGGVQSNGGRGAT